MALTAELLSAMPHADLVKVILNTDEFIRAIEAKAECDREKAREAGNNMSADFNDIWAKALRQATSQLAHEINLACRYPSRSL
jgi:hypothetical protein